VINRVALYLRLMWLSSTIRAHRKAVGATAVDFECGMPVILAELEV